VHLGSTESLAMRACCELAVSSSPGIYGTTSSCRTRDHEVLLLLMQVLIMQTSLPATRTAQAPVRPLLALTCCGAGRCSLYIGKPACSHMHAHDSLRLMRATSTDCNVQLAYTAACTHLACLHVCTCCTRSLPVYWWYLLSSITTGGW
jgi:hypothetical protein